MTLDRNALVAPARNPGRIAAMAKAFGIEPSAIVQRHYEGAIGRFYSWIIEGARVCFCEWRSRRDVLEQLAGGPGKAVELIAADHRGELPFHHSVDLGRILAEVGFVPRAVWIQIDLDAMAEIVCEYQQLSERAAMLLKERRGRGGHPGDASRTRFIRELMHMGTSAGASRPALVNGILKAFTIAVADLKVFSDRLPAAAREALALQLAEYSGMTKGACREHIRVARGGK